jgi:hypothetical protein
MKRDPSCFSEIFALEKNFFPYNTDLFMSALPLIRVHAIAQIFYPYRYSGIVSQDKKIPGESLKRQDPALLGGCSRGTGGLPRLVARFLHFEIPPVCITGKRSTEIWGGRIKNGMTPPVFEGKNEADFD